MSMIDLSSEERVAIEEYLVRKGLPSGFDVTFGDVTIPERYSEVRSRSEINDFSSLLAGNVSLGVPLLSANMESVTGVELAVALAREGGMACMPQTVSISSRTAMIEKVRRTDSAFIEDALTITSGKTLREAKEIMDRFGVYSLVVVDARGRPVGMLSTRDWRYEINDAKKVKDLMSRKPLVKASLGISFAKAEQLLRAHRVEKLPLVGKTGKLAGLITAHGLFYHKHYPRALRDAHGRFLVAGSIGVGKTFTSAHLREVEAQANLGISALVIDTARAFSINAKEALVSVKKQFPKLPVIIGNVCTPEGAKFLFEHGADGVKVNQGRGHVCRTSEIGVGTPQLSAIAKCSVIARRYGGTIVADGGMKSVGDFAKALAAGADVLMSGYFFVGTRESAAQIYFDKDGLPVKNYEGSASFQAQAKRITNQTLDRVRRPEGVTEEVPVTGTVKERVDDAIHGLASAMSYCGVRSLAEFREKAIFELQTHAGLFEGVKK